MLFDVDEGAKQTYKTIRFMNTCNKIQNEFVALHSLNLFCWSNMYVRSYSPYAIILEVNIER